MSTHAFAAYKLTITPHRQPTELVDLSNLDGGGLDLLALTHGFLKDIEREALIDVSREQYLSVSSVVPQGRTVRFTGAYGPYNQPGGQVINIRSRESVHDLTKDDAITTPVRNLILIPERETSGLLLAERYSGRGMATSFVSHLKKTVRVGVADGNLRLQYQGLTDGRTWKEFMDNARLTQIRVLRYGVSADIADENNGTAICNLEYTAKPRRGAKMFPKAVQARILDHKISAQAILGLSPDTDVDSTRLQFNTDDQQKEYSLEGDRIPVLTYPLDGEPGETPSDSAVYARMEEVAAELCRTLGVELSAGWEKGDWEAKKLAVHLGAIRGS